MKERNFQMTHSDIDKKLSSILKKYQDNFSEKLVELCRHPCADCGGALKFGSDEPCDLVLGSDAIDMKYRVGSGDSGTLKKFQQYATLLKQNGYRPVFLFLREDNLPAAMTACQAAGWCMYTVKATFYYLQEKTGFDLYSGLRRRTEKGTFFVDRRES